MSILEKVQEVETRTKRMQEFVPLIAIKAKETDESRLGEFGSFSDQTRFILQVVIAVDFWANRAQYNDSRKMAERYLLAKLYENLRPHLIDLRKAVSDGSLHDAIDALGKLQQEMEP